MFLAGFPSAVFATNCFVLAPARGEECLIVDPGIEVLDRLAETLRENRLRPAAVLLTHGHLDHVFSVTPVCTTNAVPALIHPEDEYRLADPVAALSEPMRDMLRQQFGPSYRWAAPSDVRPVTDGETVEYAGLAMRVTHAPGHTEGSVMFAFDEVPDSLVADPGAGQSRPSSTVLSGDVLFAGSIGRTDLPGGDHDRMLESLRTKVLPLADDTLILPGHGPATSMGHERATNPYLLQLS